MQKTVKFYTEVLGFRVSDWQADFFAFLRCGRDHHPFAFTMLMAGGGLRGGLTYGATDEIGWGIIENPTHVNDLHATILHLFGLDHLRLTHRFQGRDFRLTDVGGQVIDQWLA